jgi:hypothetical protein
MKLIGSSEITKITKKNNSCLNSQEIGKNLEVRKTYSTLDHNGIFILRSFPFFFWIIGILMIGLGIFLIINVAGENTIIKGFLSSGLWWQYLISISVVLFGFIFFIVAKYEKIEIDENEEKFTLYKTYLLKCKVNSISIPIYAINSIFLYKTGRESTSNSSIIYKIGISYTLNNRKHTIYCFKSIFESLVIKDVIKLNKFVFNEDLSYEKLSNEAANSIEYA